MSPREDNLIFIKSNRGKRRFLNLTALWKILNCNYAAERDHSPSLLSIYIFYTGNLVFYRTKILERLWWFIFTYRQNDWIFILVYKVMNYLKLFSSNVHVFRNSNQHLYISSSAQHFTENNPVSVISHFIFHVISDCFQLGNCENWLL